MEVIDNLISISRLPCHRSCPMTANEQNINELSVPTHEEEEYSNIPLDIGDIIAICREYNQLGYSIRQQVENILEIGVEEAIKTGYVKKESLPLIKNFLQQIIKNKYFGEASYLANEVFINIIFYEENTGISCYINRYAS
jgi:hypothetical protein